MLVSSAHEAANTVHTAGSALPAIALLLPIAGGIAVIIAGNLKGKYQENARNLTAILFTAATFVACAAMFNRVLGKGLILEARIPLVFFDDLRLAVDQVGLIFALFASLVWLAATVYSWNYIQHEERRTRYHAFSLLTEAATLGIFMASDFFVFFIFFELMGMLAYMLVVHTQTKESLEAGTRYISLTILGGLSLLMGIFLLIYYGGSASFTPVAGSSYLAGGICFTVAGFLMGGFGVKAGMVPVHVWLPLAHPAAPSPASALLSGVMIKAGAFGFIRLVGTFLSQPPSEASILVAGHGAEPALEATRYMASLHDLGTVIIIFALATMVTGMVLAVFQDNMKRLLAYSSISQMGFILVGVGTAAYLGAEGSIGLAGALEHIINHAFFKSLLFLCAGAVYYKTRTLDMRELGGLWRKMPYTTIFAVTGGLGIMGISFFNGFVSKTILHHSVTECAHIGGAWITVVDWIFIITAGGTVCYITKFLYFTFFRKPAGGKSKAEADVPVPMTLAMGGLAGSVLFLGLYPGFALHKLVVPALHMYPGLDAAAVHHIDEMRIYTGSNLFGIVYPLLIGIVAFLVLTRWDLYRFKLPARYGIDYFYVTITGSLESALEKSAAAFSDFKGRSAPALNDAREYLHGAYLKTRDGYHRLVTGSKEIFLGIPGTVKGLPGFVRARDFSLDIAFGVMLIAFAVAALALTIL